MTKHQVPDKDVAGLWGLAPDDDVIGYTAANMNKVGMLFPKFNPVVVYPTVDAVSPLPAKVLVTQEVAARHDGTSPADAKIVATDTAGCNGTGVEAIVSAVLFTTNPTAAPSLSPLGISPNMSKAQGSSSTPWALPAIRNWRDRPVRRLDSQSGLASCDCRTKKRSGLARDDDDADDGFDRTKTRAGIIRSRAMPTPMACRTRYART